MNFNSEYVDLFAELLAGYIQNELDDFIDHTNYNTKQFLSYISDKKYDVSDVSFSFCVGAAWGVTLARIIEDNNRLISDKVQRITDEFTDFVEEFSGINIP